MIFAMRRNYDYAIRICSYLAGNYGNGPIALSQIAKQLLITRPFATKIVYQLKTSSIVETIQGKQGGAVLTRAPKKISLYEILLGMGLNKPISECIEEKGFCPLPAPCKIHSFFMEQEEFLIDHLKSKSIESFAFTDKDLEKS